MKSILILSAVVGAFSIACADDFTLRDGRTITNAAVLRNDPSSVTVMTDSGVERVPLAQLPDDVQKRFSYDPRKAAAYEHQLAANAAAAAKQRAAAEALAAKKKTAIMQRGTVRDVCSAGLIVWVINHSSGQVYELVLVGNPHQRDIGVSKVISFVAYRDGVQHVAEWDQRFDRWVWVADEPETVQPPPQPRPKKPVLEPRRSGVTISDTF